MVEIEYEDEIPFAERKKVFWWCYIRSQFFWLLLSSIICIIVLCAFAYNSGISFMWKLICNLLFLLCLFGLWALLSMPKYYAESYYKKQIYNNLWIGNEGVKLEASFFSGLIKWQEFKVIRETKEFVFLLRKGNRPIVLYKNHMSSDLLEEVLGRIKDSGRVKGIND